MRQMVGGQVVDIQRESNGQIDVGALRRQLRLPNNRVLIAQNPNGSNRLMSSKGLERLDPYEHLMDVPWMKRGSV